MKRSSSSLGPGTIYESVSAFSIDLYNKVSKEDGNDAGNIFFSPYSVSGALMLTMLGARGSSEAQIKAGLRLDTLPTEDVHSEAKRLQKTIASKASRKVQMTISNRIFCGKGLNLKDGYLKDSRNYYGSETECMDFASDAEKCRKAINDWTSKETRDKIKELIPEGQLSESTIMVLTNAIYFKGKWDKPFDTVMTKESPFHDASGKKMMVQMMRMKKESWRSGRSKSYACKVLQLQYIGEDMSMVIFLPDKINGINKIENGFSTDFIKHMKKKLEEQKTIVEIPKFRIESSMKLESILPEMGISDIFSNADFSGMFEDPQPAANITNVFHSAFVGVSEEGTEAAAATAVEIDRCLDRDRGPPLEFIADHPFLFIIVENRNWTILFMGRLNKPEWS